MLSDESSVVAVGCGMKLTKKKKGPNVLVFLRVQWKKERELNENLGR